MPINWDEIQKGLSPIKDYEDLCRRLRVSFSFQFIQETYNFSFPKLKEYTHTLLEGDARNRYTDYQSKLSVIIDKLQQTGVRNVLSLSEATATRDHLEVFTQQCGIPAIDTVALLKFLIYWFIPNEKYLSGLITPGSNLHMAVESLAGLGIRTNLKLLQAGRTTVGLNALVVASKLPESVIAEIVNRADFSRLPWASKATISNIIGAGYGSLAQLACANPTQLYADFFRYGKSIGKNLKLGNEIENSYRIANIVPVILQDE